MKSKGIVRKVDELGRIVIPKELRTIMNIDIKDGLEIFTEEDTIILRKYEPCCVLFGQVEDNVGYMGKLVCGVCIEKMKKI